MTELSRKMSTVQDGTVELSTGRGSDTVWRSSIVTCLTTKDKDKLWWATKQSQHRFWWLENLAIHWSLNKMLVVNKAELES